MNAKPDGNDFVGWIKHVERILRKNAGIEINDNTVSLHNGLKRIRFGLHHQFAYLKGKEERIKRTQEKFDQMFGKSEEIETPNVVEEMEQWKRDVWRHFETSQELIKRCPKEEQVEATKDLNAFGGLIATGRSPKSYSSMIPVANLLISHFLRNEKWPKRSELSQTLEEFNFKIASSTLADNLEHLEVSDFVRDTQKG